jgi:hypothetical protein
MSMRRALDSKHLPLCLNYEENPIRAVAVPQQSKEFAICQARSILRIFPLTQRKCPHRHASRLGRCLMPAGGHSQRNERCARSATATVTDGTSISVLFEKSDSKAAVATEQAPSGFAFVPNPCRPPTASVGRRTAELSTAVRPGKHSEPVDALKRSSLIHQLSQPRCGFQVTFRKIQTCAG